MASGSAKIKEAMTEAVVKGSKEITTTMTEALKNAQGGPEVALRAAAEKHKTGSIILNKKGPRGTWAYFYRIDGQQLTDIDPNEFESLCHDEGGGGTYQVKVKVGKDLIPFGPYEVFGTPRAVPKSSVPEFGAVPPLSGGPTPGGSTKIRDSSGDSALTNNMLETMKEYQEKLAKGAADSGDRQMQMMQMFMMQQQQSSDALVRTITAAFAPQRAEPSVSPELQTLREELKALKEREHLLEQERRDRERQAQIEKLNEQIQNMRLEALKAPQDGGMSALMGQIFTAQQNSTLQNTELLKEMMRMNADKPAQSDQLAALVSTMIGAASTNIELVSKAVNSGLLGNSDSPIKDAVVRSLESIVEGVPEVIRSLAGIPQQQQQYADVEDEEMPEPMAAPPRQIPQPPESSIEKPQLPSAQTPQAPQAPAQQEAPEYTQEQLEELQQRMLTDDDISLVQRDKALTTILAKIQNGVSAKEISLRVWAHKESRNRVAEKWWKDPGVVTHHLVGIFGIGDATRATKIAQDMDACRKYIEKGGDPNSWSDTDYLPVKKTKKIDEPADDDVEEPPEGPAEERPVEDSPLDPDPEDPPDIPVEKSKEPLPAEKTEWSPETINEGVTVSEP